MASSCSMKRAVVMIFTLCMVVVLMADDAQAACSLNDMAPCLDAVTSGAAPTEPCCLKVAAVDVVCFCNLVATGNYPQSYVNNAVVVPAKCGGSAYAHFKGKVCAGHTIT
ncbi:hypothetical protein M758_UG134800 [Ceratodon purpureus]|nr:hypothetical protein M758_UG134800 [Ceratodon purpureus]